MTTSLRTILVIVGAALLAFAPVFWGAFVFDDMHSVRDNPALRSLGNIPSFFVDAGTFSTSGRMYRPVLVTTFAFNWSMAGGAVLAFKLTSFAIHAAVAVMLWFLARRLKVSERGALVAALFFAVHPLCTEAVHMVSSRSEQMLVFGCLVAALGWLRGGVAGKSVALLGTFLACGSKETGVVIPGLLLTLEWLRRREPGFQWRSTWLALLPQVALVLGYLWTRKAVLGVATVDLPPATGGEDHLTGWGRDLVTHYSTMAANLPRLLSQSVVPVGLTLDPEVHWMRSLASPAVLGGIGLMGLWTWLGVRRGAAVPARLQGTAMAWALSLPWIVIPLNQPLAEHRTYGLVAGIALALGSCIGAASAGRPIWERSITGWPGVVGASVFAVLAFVRGMDFESQEKVWASAVVVHPRSFQAQWGYGVELAAEREYGDAEDHLRLAHAIHPRHRGGRQSLTDLYLELGAVDGAPWSALTLVEANLHKDGDNPYYRIQKARALIQVGELTGESEWFDEAEEVALSCLEIASPKALVFKSAAMARHAAGDVEGAVAHLDDSVQRGLDHFTVFLMRAAYLRELGRTADARRDVLEAAQRRPDHPAVQAAMRNPGAAPR